MLHHQPAHISALDLIKTHDNVVLWGGDEHSVGRLLRRSKLEKPIRFVYSTEISNKKLFPGVSLLNSIEELMALQPAPLVLIHENHISKIRRIAKELSRLGLSFDHASFYTSQVISVQYLQALEVSSYIDLDSNHITVHPMATGRIDVRIGEAGVSRKNIIEIGKISAQDRLLILAVGSAGELRIGDNTTFVQTNLVFNSNGKISIGNDCMFARDIELNQSDSHHIFDAKTGERLNENRSIEIENHIWAGRGVQLLAGCRIGNGSIIGAGSVTSSTFGSNLAIAGCPAKVLREGVMWSRDLIKHASRPSIYECEDQEGLKYT